MNDTTPLFTLPPPQEAPSGHEDVQDGAMDKKSPPFSFPLQPFGQVAPENVQHGTMNKEIIQRQPFTFDEMNNLWEIIMEEMRRDNDKVPDPRTTKFWRRMKAKHQNLWRLENTYAKKFKTTIDRSELHLLSPDDRVFLLAKMIQVQPLKPEQEGDNEVSPQKQMSDERKAELDSLVNGHVMFKVLSERNPELLERWLRLTQLISSEVQALTAEGALNVKP